MHIAAAEVNAWFEPSKLSLSVDEFTKNPENVQLESQIVTQVFSRLRAVFDTSTWVDNATTPKLVKSICAMLIAAWIYDRVYSENAELEETATYAELLRRTAEANIQMLLSGMIVLEENPTAAAGIGQPSFFPNDLSSSLCPTSENPSDGPPAFTMGQVF